jgi:hypothetical protein
MMRRACTLRQTHGNIGIFPLICQRGEVSFRNHALERRPAESGASIGSKSLPRGASRRLVRIDEPGGVPYKPRQSRARNQNCVRKIVSDQ